jgi:beta propeller repeat protein
VRKDQRRIPGTLLRRGAALMVIGLIPLVSGPIVGQAQEGYSTDEFTVERADGDQIKPQIDGGFAVWQDYRDLPNLPIDPATPNADIHGRDIENGNDFKVTDNHTAAHPAISGSRVVYADSRNKDKDCDNEKCKIDIRGYDINSSDVFDVVERKGDQDFPAIDGARVVWQDNRDGNWDIRGYDIDDDRSFSVIERDGDQVKPRISERKVVWEDQRRGADQPDIYFVDLDDDNSPRRVTDSGQAHDPDIDGDYIVYTTGDPNGDGQRIRLYTISTKDDRGISERTKITSAPRISGRLVVWSDRRNEEDDNVWGYDIDNDVEFKLTGAERNQVHPDISGKVAVWQDGRGDNPPDIRGGRLTLGSGSGSGATPTPTSTSSSSATPPPTSGPCQYILGFKTLHDQIADKVGPCVTSEYWNEIGDSNQITQGGLMAWRKADNWTAFTNGSMTWLNGPCGIQMRPNAGPFFSWEGRVGASC